MRSFAQTSDVEYTNLKANHNPLVGRCERPRDVEYTNLKANHNCIVVSRALFSDVEYTNLKANLTKNFVIHTYSVHYTILFSCS